MVIGSLKEARFNIYKHKVYLILIYHNSNENIIEIYFIGREAGINFAYDRVVPTLNSHRLNDFAKKYGKLNEVLYY